MAANMLAVLMTIYSSAALESVCGEFFLELPPGTVAIELTGTAIYTPNFFSAAIDEAMEADVEEHAEISTVTFTQNDTYGDTGAFDTTKISFVVGNLTKEQASILITAANLAAENLVEVLNDGREDYYNNTVEGSAIPINDRVGKVVKVEILNNCEVEGEAPPAEDSDPLKAKAKTKLAATMKGLACETISENPQRYCESLSTGLGSALGFNIKSSTCKVVNPNGVDIDFRLLLSNGCPQNSRRLSVSDILRRRLASSDEIEVDVEMEQLTVSQVEQLKATLSDDEAFNEDLMQRLAAEDPDGSLGLASLTPGPVPVPEVTGGGAAFLYTPREYQRTKDVETLNGYPRLNGASNTLELADVMTYIIGVILISIPCFLCIFFNMWVAPCCYCCCVCPAKDTKPLTKSPHTYMTLVFSLVALVGLALASAGNGHLNTGLTDFVGSLGEIKAFVIGALDNVNLLISSIDRAATISRENSDVCPITDNFATMFSQELENPLDDSIATSISGIADQVTSVNGTRGTTSVLLIVFPFLCCLFYTASILSYQAGKPIKALRTCSLVCFPFVWIFILLLWIVAVFNTTVGVILADFCYTDPLEFIVTTIDVEGLGYMLACKGAPPEALIQITDYGNTFSGLSSVIENLDSLIATDANCAGTNTEALKAELEVTGNTFLTLVDTLRCKFPNTVLADVLYDQLCSSVVSGARSLYAGLFCIGVALVGNWLLWKRVLNTHYKSLGTVHPGDDAAGEAQAPKEPAATPEGKEPAATPE